MIHVRPARSDDYPRVLELITELAVFEKEPDAVEVTVEELQKHAASNPPLYNCFVGEYDGKIEGIALCYPRFSTWKGKTIHLEDLIVTEKMRGKGLGKALYDRVLTHAQEQKVTYDTTNDLTIGKCLYEYIIGKNIKFLLVFTLSIDFASTTRDIYKSSFVDFMIYHFCR